MKIHKPRAICLVTNFCNGSVLCFCYGIQPRKFNFLLKHSFSSITNFIVNVSENKVTVLKNEASWAFLWKPSDEGPF